MTAWRCPVCEGVNEGGRVCTTCGAELPAGAPLPVIGRTTDPSTIRPDRPAPATRRAPRPPATGGPTAEEVFGSDPWRSDPWRW